MGAETCNSCYRIRKNYGIEFSVYGKGTDLLGKGTLENISSYDDGQSHEIWVPLSVVKNGEKADGGQVSLSLQILSKDEVALKFWNNLLTEFDHDNKGGLDKAHLSMLLEGIGMFVSDSELDQKFKEVDKDGNQLVTAEELQIFFGNQTFEIANSRSNLKDKSEGKKDSLEEEEALKRCKAEALWDIVAVAVSDKHKAPEDDSFVIGSFLTESYASRGFGQRLVNRVLVGDYKINEDNGNIFAKDRKTGQLVEEAIPGFVRMGIRAIYQNNMNLDQNKILLNTLKMMSFRQGKSYNNPSSAKHIRSFIDFYQLNMEESLEPVENFKTFNEFFYRKLKRSARPIADEGNDSVVVSAADCRLMVFPDVSEATKLWIKGKNFSLSALMKDEKLAKNYEGGSLIIFRLAPQDYHRFHSPVTGKIVSMMPYGGEYITVSPMAVRADVDVFTENKRVVTVIETKEFGNVVFVAVGATMVGSITFTKLVGEDFKKGDELGFFAFGGSTTIAVFPPGKITIDSDLVANSKKPLETLVKVGERIGSA